MILLSKARDFYDNASAKAGDVARQLAFAGFAVVWLFHVTSEGNGPTLPPQFLMPVSLLVVALALDLLQYIWSTVIWGWFQYSRARKVVESATTEVEDAPDWYNVPTLLFFGGKLVAVMAGYAHLFYAVRLVAA